MASRSSKIDKTDVANSAVRNILIVIAERKYGPLEDNDLLDAAKFFDYKCPYTGKDIKNAILNNDKTLITMDHIVPTNRFHCGLNVRGNVIYVDYDANLSKGRKTVEDFLLHDTKVLGNTPLKVREERLEKIKEFQRQFNYDPVEIERLVKEKINEHYDKIIELQKNLYDELSGLIILKSDDQVNLELSKFRDYLAMVKKSKTSISIYYTQLRKMVKLEGRDIDYIRKNINNLIDEYNYRSSKDLDDHGNMINALSRFREYLLYEELLGSNHFSKKMMKKYEDILEIYIPKNIVTIDKDVFKNCKKLKKVMMERDITEYPSLIIPSKAQVIKF